MLAAKVVERRHLFDHGYPVANATLIAGSDVLLAIGRQSLRKSSHQLARSVLLLADSSGRVLSSLERCGRSHAELADSRDNYCYGASPGQPVKRDTGVEPPDRPARAEPHHR